MATKLQLITEMSEHTTQKLTDTYENWTAFLRTAAWNYKYSFAEQVLIYAQRPDATACASIELWNEKLRRWVNRGAKGIALIDDSREKLALRYVFDISDTSSRNSESVYFWTIPNRYEEAVTEALENAFGELETKATLADALISTANNLVDDNLTDYLTELMNIHLDSFLEELDGLNVEVELNRALKASVSYMLLVRCGIDVTAYFDREDFASIWDFNTLPVISLLGNATSDISEMALREIGSTVSSLHIEERRAEKFALSQNIVQNRATTNYDERGAEHGNDLHDAGRLPAARPDAFGAAEHREIWDAAKIVSKRAPESDVHQPAAVRKVDGTSGGDRSDGAGTRGTDDRTDGRDGGRERSDESRRSDEMGGADEQPEALGGGNGSDGADLQLEWHDRETEDRSLPFFHSDAVIKDILCTTPHLKATGQDIADFYSAHEDDDERTEYIKNIFNNESTQLILDGNRTVGYKTYRNVLHLWEGDEAHKTSQSYYYWGVIARYFGTMLTLGELPDRPTPPSEQEQIILIEQAESEKASAFLLPQEAIDEILRQGSGVQDGRLRIYTQLHKNVTTKENADFIKHEYGVGGRYPILTGTDINEMHDGKGIQLKSKKYIGPDKDLLLTWPKVTKRIGELIAVNRYLTGKEKERLPAFEQEQAERAQRLAEQQEARAILARAPQPNRENADYVLSLGAEVHIGTDPFEILSFDDERVVLYDPAFPLFNKEMPREEFDRKIRENPLNDHLIVKDAQTAAEKSAEDVFDEYSALFVSKVLFDEAYMNARESSDAQNARIECDAAVERVFHTFDPLEHTALYRAFTETPGFAQRVRDHVFRKTYSELISAEQKPQTPTETTPPPLAELTAEDFEAYNALKERVPDTLVAFRAGHYYELYGEDAAAARDILHSNMLQREIPGVGTLEMTGFLADEWVSHSHRLWRSGQNIVLYEPDEDGGYSIVKRLSAAEYIPLGMELTIDDRSFTVDSVDFAQDKVSLRDVTFAGATGFPIFRVESIDFVRSFVAEQQPEPSLKELLRGVTATRDGDTVTIAGPNANADTKYIEMDVTLPDEPETLTPAWEKHADRIVRAQIDLLPDTPPEQRLNFHITDDELGYGGPKTKYGFNVAAIRTLQQIETEGRLATAEEQEVLSRYVGWGGIPDAFDENRPEWAKEYAELKGLLSDDEYRSARESVLNAHYTSPVVIKAIYSALESMGFRTGNILEPGCGVGNFLGLVPESMENSRLYGIEIDSITGRIAHQLYQRADIRIQGFETADLPDSFFDVAVGNVPFGQYSVPDKRYDKLKLSIHDYFFIKTLDKVRPGGVVAFITSSFTMDKKNSAVRKYIAERAELLGAVRLPNNAFLRNAGTSVVTDILFLQKRDRPIETEPDWIHLGKTGDDFAINQYFIDNPDMVLGQLIEESTQYGHMACTCAPIPGAELSEQLRDAMANIHAEIIEYDVEDLSENSEGGAIPADPSVRNFSFALADGKIYYRENSRMNPVETSATGENRIKGMVEIRDSVRQLIDYQTEDYSDEDIRQEQARLNRLYDRFTGKYGLLNSRANSTVFSDDSSSPLLCSLEVLDDEGNLKRKADMFSKRTIRRRTEVTHVDAASEALAVSIGERARVDLGFMASLTGKPNDIDGIINELQGIIYKDPESGDDPYTGWQTTDEYLSGNVRTKLSIARKAVEDNPAFTPNVEALEAVQPVDLTAAEISVRLGATWLPPDVVEQFVHELLSPAFYIRRNIKVHYMPYTSEWNIEGKNQDRVNVKANATYGTDRANAYKIIEETLNLRDVRVFDAVYDASGNRTYVINKKETAIARQKQALIKQEFTDWIWKDPDRRERLCRLYNDKFNSIRPREYDGRHIQFVGMNPEMTLRTHQINAVARQLYGGNTLLAHVVGAGKTYEMIAAAMESKRLGLCQKSMIVVPNHLTEQWAGEFLQLYPAANVLVATRKDFETKNRKKFCGRIATGDFDAVIIGHSQFEKIPLSVQRQKAILNDQIDCILDSIADAKANRSENFTIKQLEKSRKSLELKLSKLNDQSRKDDVVTFEELGVDRLFIDESHFFKNLFLFTKMRNVGGIAQTEAQKSSDLFAKCRYLDELTGNRGIVFATGTPISNSMVELYTVQRYLQYDALHREQLQNFDAWASNYGETVTAIELSPEGTGYRSKTRFAKFYNLPELMAMFKEVSDIQTADMLDLPVPKAIYHNVALKPSELQREMVADLSERADRVRNKEVEPNEDNMLMITNDGRKLALDQRLMNPMLPDHENSKVASCAENVFALWQEHIDTRATQLIFCDLSTPKNDGSFNVYDDIRNKLIAKGVPAEEIAFIHDANTETKKKELFGKVRSGQVRVLMGSTFKMGAGTNVQDRLIAIHHLDCPWRPSDLEQRGGRILRQGNMNPEAHIFRYVTEGTFDAYLYQIIENKQRFISQIMTSKAAVRSAEDIDEAALSYAEVKALATGNPYIKEKMGLEADVANLNLFKANYLKQRYALEDAVLKEYPMQIKQAESRIAGLKEDIVRVAEHPLPTEEKAFVGITVFDTDYTDKGDGGQAILDACKGMSSPEPIRLGSYRGFELELSFETYEHKYKMTLRGARSYTINLGTDIHGNITRMDNALEDFPDRLSNAERDLENTRQQQSNARAELERPFTQENELKTKSARLAELDALLNLDKTENEIVDDERDEDEPDGRSTKEYER